MIILIGVLKEKNFDILRKLEKSVLWWFEDYMFVFNV